MKKVIKTYKYNRLPERALPVLKAPLRVSI
jgi:hypothetical protein